ncbi:MAG: right-handed parallel beta-helix repeat-containing protein [Candidatus Promineofilum sp.]|nr:right-handed parallel beta-helix repeat-containing protein [Promineifilum sp.]
MSAKRIGIVLVLLLFALLPSTSHAAGRVGSTAQSPAFDAGDCQTVVEAGGSIQAAITAASNGAVICVRDGIYYEIVVVPATKTGLTIIAYPGEAPIIDGDKLLPGGMPGDRFRSLVELLGQGTVFDGFEVRFSSARGLEVGGNNIIVRNSSINNNWNAGITVRGVDDSRRIANVLIENNLVYSNLRKVRHVPVIYRGERIGSGPTDWLFDPDMTWDNPYWTGKEADIPESALNAISMTFNDDGRTSRIYASSARTNREGHIGEEFSASGLPIDYTGRDLLFFEPATNKWTHYFDGAALAGLSTTVVIDAFQIDGSLPPESLPCPQCAPIVMSFGATVTITIGGVPQSIGPSDLVRFSPTAVSAANVITAGAFTLERTAAAMGLPAAANIDALDRTPDGRQLMSFADDLTLGAQTFSNEDLIAFDVAAATWTLYFDGNQIPYNPFSDDLTAAWLDRDGHLYISGDPVGGSALVFIFADNSIGRGNVIYNNYGEGLVAGRYSSYITLEDNVAYDNDHANIYINDTAYPLVQRNVVFCTDDREFWRKGHATEYRPGGGLVLRDEDFDPMPPPSVGQVVINNIVSGCSTNLEVGTQQPGGGLNSGLIANNVFINGRADVANAVDNVVFGSGVSLANSRFINNMIIQTVPGDLTLMQGSLDTSTLTVANNLYSSTPANWFPGESGRVVGDPRFANGLPPLPTVAGLVNPADFRLSYDSPAVDAGQSLAEVLTDFFGKSRAGSGRPDIGLDELPHIGGIVVEQVTVPDGASQTFDYTASYAAGFQLSDGQQHQSGVLSAGSYSVAVAPVAGWNTTAVCDDGSSPDAIDLGPAETVTCTFTSRRDPGLTVTNVVEPADATQLFDFALAPGTTFQLGHQSRTFDLTPGTYALTATTPAGWERTGATCDNGDPLTAIVLDAGDAVTCTVVHRQLGRIHVIKQTQPDGATQSFAFTANYDGDGFSLSDGEQNDSGFLPAGAYSVAETLPTGWAQTAATCDDGSSPTAITLSPGETVICTFENARLGLGLTLTPTPEMVTAPGGNVSFAVAVTNSGSAALTLTDLSDSVYDNVANAGNAALVSTTCALPQTVAAGAAYTCAYTAQVSGAAGDTRRNTLTATAAGPGGVPLSAAAEASVSVVAAPTGRIIVIKQTIPANTPGSFLFSASYDADGFSLSHGQSNDSGPLPSGVTYSVSESVPTGWTLDSAICSDGSIPTAINLSANETVTCTFTNRRTTSGPSATIYVTAPGSGSVGGIAYAVGDILAYNGLTGVWSMVFDGSDVGWTKGIGDFEFLPDGSLLLTTNTRFAVGTGPARFTLEVQDIARFVPTSLNGNTAGSFALYFDGSDVSLTTAAERIDALARKPDGTLLISTAGKATVTGGVIGQDEDLLAFQSTSLGNITAGTWSLVNGFDGSLLTGMVAENVSGAWFDGATDDLYLTLTSAFTVGGVSGNQKQVLKVTPARVASIYWNATTNGYNAAIDGLFIAP